jgi:hypothetical protein
MLPRLFAPFWVRWGTPTEYAKRAFTQAERLRVRAELDAIVATLYGLSYSELQWLIRDCDHPVASVCDDEFSRALDPKGFWRVDKKSDPELRHTVLTLAAFQDLSKKLAEHGDDRESGLQAFCSQNDGEGWMLPEMLCLEDLGLGHDERAKSAQPVRARLSERFQPWQLEQSVEQLWSECEQDARDLLGPEGLSRLEPRQTGEPGEVQAPALLKVAEGEATPYASVTPVAQARLSAAEPTLFGDVTEDPPPTRHRRRRR